MVLSQKSEKSQVPILHEFRIQFNSYFGIVFGSILNDFIIFLDVDFRMNFWICFSSLSAPTWLPNGSQNRNNTLRKIKEKPNKIEGGFLDAKMVYKCSKFAPKSMPNPCQNASGNRCQTRSEKWWMARPTGTHRAGPTGSTLMAKIHPFSNPCDQFFSIHWLSARRPNHKRGNLMCWNKLGNVPIGP